MVADLRLGEARYGQVPLCRDGGRAPPSRETGPPTYRRKPTGISQFAGGRLLRLGGAPLLTVHRVRSRTPPHQAVTLGRPGLSSESLVPKQKAICGGTQRFSRSVVESSGLVGLPWSPLRTRPSRTPPHQTEGCAARGVVRPHQTEGFYAAVTMRPWPSSATSTETVSPSRISFANSLRAN